jgi:uncharacterized membrane protein YbaN (DUF454 family)
MSKQMVLVTKIGLLSIAVVICGVILWSLPTLLTAYFAS